MNWRDNLQHRFNTAGMTEKLIAINVAVFAVCYIVLRLLSFLFQIQLAAIVEQWLILPDQLGELATRPWTVVTYAFMHAGLWHILSNMIILYFSGRFFLTFFSAKRMLNYYFLGALAGAAFFILSYNLFPAFADSGADHLLGASAAVMAILIGVATQAPNMKIRLMFLGNIKLWWIAAFFVGQDILFIPIENPGGHIAHLGGAALGYIYTKQLGKGVDIGAWFEKFMDGIVGLFSSRKQNPFKSVYKNKRKPKGPRGPYKEDTQKGKQEKQAKIDAVLDKISKNGYDSLTKKEKELLFRAGKD